MRNSTLLVRGGQTTQHWIRMAGQVFITLLVCSVLAFLVCYTPLIYFNFDIVDLRLGTAMFWADVYNGSLGKPHYPFTIIDLEGTVQTLTANELSNNDAIREFLQTQKSKAQWFFWISMIPAGLAGLVVLYFYARTGKELGQTKHERGTQLVTHDALKAWANKKWAQFERQFGTDAGGPRYTIAQTAFPPNSVQAQTGIFGTVGVGKTTAIIELLEKIRHEGGRAIVYDRMGTLVEKFYDPQRGDKIINPFDARSVSWSPFGEADDAASFAQMAEVLIPTKADAPDPFWSASARIVFEFAARKLMQRNEGTNKNLREAISVITDEELIDLVEQTPAARMMSRDNPKTAANIRSNLIQELRFFEFLRDDAEPFSIRDWVKNEHPGFIFLTGDSEHSAATRNIISACCEIAANALMTCGQAKEPKLWFFLDEVPTLNRLPFLESKLAEIRQFGGAFVLGYQVYAQLVTVYGPFGAEAISGVLNNRLVFNSPDPDTAERFSKSLGSEDIVDQRHNITMGAHTTRDGVGYSEQRVERRIVTPSEIQSLPQLEGYLRFAYDAPAALVKFDYISRPTIAKPFEPYVGTGFDEGALEGTTGTVLGQTLNTGIAKHNARKSVTKEDALRTYIDWKSARLQHAKNLLGVHLNPDTDAPLLQKYAPFDPALPNLDLEEAIESWYREQDLWQHFWREWNTGKTPAQIGEVGPQNRYTKDELIVLFAAQPEFPYERSKPSTEPNKEEQTTLGQPETMGTPREKELQLPAGEIKTDAAKLPTCISEPVTTDTSSVVNHQQEQTLPKQPTMLSKIDSQLLKRLFD